MIQWAKKTGDYSVLSHADMCVIALTYMLNEEYKKEQAEREEYQASNSTVYVRPGILTECGLVGQAFNDVYTRRDNG